MHPEIAYQLARQRMADLEREAATERIARASIAGRSQAAKPAPAGRPRQLPAIVRLFEAIRSRRNAHAEC